MQTSVAIVGGGVIGCLCAWQLAQAGFAVTLFESNTIGNKNTQASSAAFGALVPYGAHRTDWLPTVHRESVKAWGALAQKLGAADIDYRENGGLRTTPDGLAVEDTAMSALNPPKTMRALAGVCVKAGVFLHENTPAPALKTLANTYHHVIVACGLGINSYLHLPAESPLVRPVWGDVLQVKSANFKLEKMMRAGQLFCIPQADGSFLIGGNKWQKPEETQQKTRHADLLKQAENVLHLPENSLEIIQHWQGARPLLTHPRTTLFDVHGIHPNVLICAGYGGIGWCLAPAVAQSVAKHLKTAKKRP